MKKLATMLKIAAVMAVALFLGGGVTTELTGWGFRAGILSLTMKSQPVST